jgi:putative salt-induced outer membrane protein
MNPFSLEVSMSTALARIVLAGLLLALALPVLAQEETEEPARAWTNEAEFSYVSTTGNAETTTLSFSDKYEYKWEKAKLTVFASALRADATTVTLENFDGSVTETRVKEKTAENYELALGYRREISKRFYWYAGTGWYRNRFSGIDDRYGFSGGVGYKLIDGKKHILDSEVGLGYTWETQVTGIENNFTDARVFFGYDFLMSESAKLDSDLTILPNLDDSDDLRVNWITAVTASLTSKLALRLSYAVKYDRQPALTVIPPSAGAPPGTPDALYEFETTDTILSASLVVKF